jgi:hypothetical protein
MAGIRVLASAQDPLQNGTFRLAVIPNIALVIPMSPVTPIGTDVAVIVHHVLSHGKNRSQ